MKKALIIGSIVSLFALVGVVGQSPDKKLYVEDPQQVSPASSIKSENTVDSVAPASAAPVETPAPAPTTNDSSLSNNNYYTNSSGNEVHSPAATTDNSVPAGASAQCRDGSYSFSQSRSGTCSHHGGVATWL